MQLPAPTAWPFALALGCSLLFAGLVTTYALSVLGILLSVAGCVGWFREVLPHERHETVAAIAEPVKIATTRSQVARLEIAPELDRPRLPIEIYPLSAGIKGGLAGSVAMAVMACLYGVLKQGSIWYPINLLSAMVYANPENVSMASMKSFHIELLLVASLLHVSTSVLMGLVYGALLPMFPRRPILLGGFIAPIVWSGLLYSILGVINPVMDQHVDWKWFIASQIAFGVVAGLIVVRQAKVRTYQHLPFRVRAGFEVPGMMDEKHEERP